MDYPKESAANGAQTSTKSVSNSLNSFSGLFSLK